MAEPTQEELRDDYERRVELALRVLDELETWLEGDERERVEAELILDLQNMIRAAQGLPHLHTYGPIR